MLGIFLCLLHINILILKEKNLENNGLLMNIKSCCCQCQYFLFSKSLKVKSDGTKMTEYVLADKLIELTFGISL